jgi:hypothetical protein
MVSLLSPSTSALKSLPLLSPSPPALRRRLAVPLLLLACRRRLLGGDRGSLLSPSSLSSRSV